MRTTLRPVFVLAAVTAAAQTPAVQTVRGAPFTALVESQTSQTLADGNTITRRSTAQLARDSEGRTRREQASAVFITDPVAGFAFVLDTAKQIALRTPISIAPNAPATLLPTATTDLGIRTLHETTAAGTRVVRAIPAGEQGNDHPIDIATEAWYSQELHTVVETTTTDPRIGFSTWKLTGIKRDEPPRSFFEVPAGYSVTDAAQKASPQRQ